VTHKKNPPMAGFFYVPLACERPEDAKPITWQQKRQQREQQQVPKRQQQERLREQQQERREQRLLLFCHRRPEQQQRSRRPERGSCSFCMSLNGVENNFRKLS
jgi:hypothetical protein